MNGSVEDYLRATAEAVGLGPEAAVAHLDQTLARNAETRPGAHPGEVVCEGCIHGPACRVIPCTECGKRWHMLGQIEPPPYICPRCEEAALPCRITRDGWCANHSTGFGPAYCTATSEGDPA